MPSPQTQKAVFLDKKFGDLIIKETEVYKPGPGELLVKVVSTSLNPIDWKVQKEGLIVTQFPAVLGTDIAGDVEEVGEGVTEFQKGDRVFTHGIFENRHASFQQYTVIWASATARIPPNLTYDDVSPIPLVLTTSIVGMYNISPHGMGLTAPTFEQAIGKYAGTPFVVIGGSSSVGQVVIQLARISGFSPIITTASLKHAEHLKSLGATYVIDRNRSSTEIVDEMKKAGNPIKYVYDCVSSSATQQLGLDALSPGGQLAVVIPPTVESSADKTVIHIWGNSRVQNNVKLVESFYHDTVYGLIEKGLLKANNIEVLPNGIAGIPDGLERLAADQVSALKLVAHPQEFI